jgi:hypothetical protein
MARDGRSRATTGAADVSPHLRFLRRLPLTLLVAMAVWLALRPALDSAVPWLTEVVVRAFEYPRVTRLEPENHLVRVIRADFRSDSKIPTIPLTENHFNTIVLLALYLALPRPLSRQQLERLFMGWSVLYLTQALNLTFHVKTLYALGLGEWSQQSYSDLARNVYGFGRYFTDLPGRFSFPFLIWLGFNWDHLLQLLGRPEAGPGAGAADEARAQRRRRSER